VGVEFNVDSLEDMCALMCDNVIPRRKRMTNTDYLNNAINTLQSAKIKDSDKERYGITDRFALGYNRACDFAVEVIEDLKEKIGGE